MISAGPAFVGRQVTRVFANLICVTNLSGARFSCFLKYLFFFKIFNFYKMKKIAIN